MALIRVTAAQLRMKAEELTELNNGLKTNVSELEACEQNLGSMWEGQAKDAFHTAFGNDKIQMTNFSMLIDRYVAALLSIAAKYEQAESQNAETAAVRKYK
ncbi:MAG: WXG100 family type VII secretion target [Clostridiales bacterium]|nr:WXG100 family type VII secretion target [Clostridiales bacterium]